MFTGRLEVRNFVVFCVYGTDALVGVQTFEKKAKTGMMYCIIVALLILLIVLVAVPAPK